MARVEDYAACGEYERHFNTVQGGVRTLASAWILAAFGGFSALLLQGTDKKWLLPPAVLLAVMCFMATVGLGLLWLLDQFIYQKLLGSVFLVGLRMEQLNASLPPTRALMVDAFDRRGASPLIGLFYLVPAALFALVTLATRIVFDSNLSRLQGWVVIVLFALEALLLLRMVESLRRVPAQSQAAAISDDLRALYADRTRLAQVISSANLTISPTRNGPGRPAQQAPPFHRLAGFYNR